MVWAAVCSIAATARTQTWPAKPIQLIVPFPPGGGSDTFARPFAAKLTAQLGQQVVIDNRAGAAGTIGAAAVAKAAPDGYTLLLGAVHHTVAANVYKALTYDLERDLVPITGVAYVPDVLVMNPGVPATTLGEFIAYCKANPGKVNYGSSGVGTSRHLAGEIFNAMTGAAMVHVPHHRRGRFAGFRVAFLVRALGASRHAARHHDPASGGGCAGLRVAGHERGLVPPGRRAGW
jgi:tripartite-type tricarboxylate transporter receptor subunit TctC